MSTSIPAQSSDEFLEDFIPLYSGPQVTIRLSPSNREYKLSKALVCKHSPIFSATFEGSFREGHEQATTLQEENGVVSLRSFGLLVQWMYQGQVCFDDTLNPSESISAAIEFSRIADMYGVTGMEERMGEHIKSLIKNAKLQLGYGFDPHTRFLHAEHIVSAVQLPSGHPVRATLAASLVREYLIMDHRKFAKEEKEIPGFASDLLDAVKEALKTVRKSQYSGLEFIDPIRDTIEQLS